MAWFPLWVSHLRALNCQRARRTQSKYFLNPEQAAIAAKVGGWVVMATSDMRRVAPKWLEFTEKVREYGNPAWNMTGDAYVSIANPKPWISEMYGACTRTLPCPTALPCARVRSFARPTRGAVPYQPPPPAHRAELVYSDAKVANRYS